MNTWVVYILNFCPKMFIHFFLIVMLQNILSIFHFFLTKQCNDFLSASAYDSKSSLVKLKLSTKNHILNILNI